MDDDCPLCGLLDACAATGTPLSVELLAEALRGTEPRAREAIVRTHWERIWGAFPDGEQERLALEALAATQPQAESEAEGHFASKVTGRGA